MSSLSKLNGILNKLCSDIVDDLDFERCHKLLLSDDWKFTEKGRTLTVEELKLLAISLITEAFELLLLSSDKTVILNKYCFELRLNKQEDDSGQFGFCCEMLVLLAKAKTSIQLLTRYKSPTESTVKKSSKRS